MIDRSIGKDKYRQQKGIGQDKERFERTRKDWKNWGGLKKAGDTEQDLGLLKRDWRRLRLIGQDWKSWRY